MAKTTEMVEVAIDLLKPYENNAKKHGDNQLNKLKNSIREFGFLTPCIVDSDYNLIAGHGRVMAAKAIGLEKVPCVFVEGLTDEQKKAYILADNRLGELGEWDMDIVFSELRELEDADFDISLTGFSLDIETVPQESKEIDFKENISVVIECEDEEQAEEIYNEMMERGLECRISTL